MRIGQLNLNANSVQERLCKLGTDVAQMYLPRNHRKQRHYSFYTLQAHFANHLNALMRFC